MDALERENRELSNSIQKWWKKIGHEFERRSDQRKNEIRSAQGYNGRNPSIGNSKKWDSFDPNKLDTGTFSPLCKFWKVHARITPEIKLINDLHVRNPDDTFRILFCIIHVLYTYNHGHFRLCWNKNSKIYFMLVKIVHTTPKTWFTEPNTRFSKLT